MPAEGKGDGQVIGHVTSSVPVDASAKLSAESNQIGMTGIVGDAERIYLTTQDGVLHLKQGICCHEQRIFAAVEQRNFAGAGFGLSEISLTQEGYLSLPVVGFTNNEKGPQEVVFEQRNFAGLQTRRFGDGVGKAFLDVSIVSQD